MKLSKPPHQGEPVRHHNRPGGNELRAARIFGLPPARWLGPAATGEAGPSIDIILITGWSFLNCRNSLLHLQSSKQNAAILPASLAPVGAPDQGDSP